MPVTVPVKAGLASLANTVVLSMACATNSVVANCVFDVPVSAVGAVGIPVKAILFFWLLTNAVVAICVVFVFAVAVGARGTPVNVGLLISDFKLICSIISPIEVWLLPISVARDEIIKAVAGVNPLKAYTILLTSVLVYVVVCGANKFSAAIALLLSVTIALFVLLLLLLIL